MKRQKAVLLAVAVMLVLSGCSGEKEAEVDKKQETKALEENTTRLISEPLLQDAEPERSALTLWEYDGTTIKRSFLFDKEKEEEIITYINGLKVIENPDAKLADISFPLYGIEIGGKDDIDIKAAYGSGFWITKDSICQVDIDFKKLKQEYIWEEEDEFPITAFPCIRRLALMENQWNPKYMKASEDVKESSLILEVLETKANMLKVKIFNKAQEGKYYGEAFGVQVYLEDTWYDVPMEQDVAYVDIAYEIAAGGETEKNYDLTPYGKLPQGNYRLLVQGAVAPFTVE